MTPFYLGVLAAAIRRDGGFNFSPADLFARDVPVPPNSPSSEVATYGGLWYDPNDLSTLFQDTAGTIPVTTVGQKVARMNDKGSHGNHVTQATVSAQPVLGQDARGIYYLQFDGANSQSLGKESPTGLASGATPMFAAAASILDAVVGSPWVFGRGSPVTLQSYVLGYSGSNALACPQGDAFVLNTQAAGEPTVVSWRHVGTSHHPRLELATEQTDSSDPLLGVARIRVGADVSVAGANFFTGKFYGAVELTGATALVDRERVVYALAQRVNRRTGNPDRRGCWYDIGDLSTLFTTNDLSTPASVNGPVGAILDKSGANNHLGGDDGPLRPTLRQDSNGKYYLEFTGTEYLGRYNNSADAPIRFMASGAEPSVIFIASLSTVTTGDYHYFRGDNGTNQARLIYRDGNGVYTSNLSTGIMQNLGMPKGAGQILVSVREEQGEVAQTYADLAPATAMDNVPLTDVGVDQELILGARAGSASNRLTGRIYGAIEVTGRLTDEQRINAIMWLMRRSGMMGSATPTPFYEELTVVNPGAESGTTGWTGTTGFAAVSGPAAPADGSAYFIAGTTAVSTFYQDVAVPPGRYDAVDTGGVYAKLAWLQAGFDGGTDTGRCELVYLDGADVELGRTVGQGRMLTQTFIPRELEGYLPQGTRKVRIVGHAVRTFGTNNDAYYDRFRLALAAGVQPKITQLAGSAVIRTDPQVRVTQVAPSAVIKTDPQIQVTQVAGYMILKL